MVMKPFLVLILFCLIRLGFSQDFSREGIKPQFQKLNDREKVKFINQNFYKLYSADFEHAAELAKWASTTAHEQHWPEEEANGNLSWGVIIFLSGKYDEVLPKYFRARTLFDSIGDKRGLARLNNEMAVFYHKQKDLENALKCLDVAEGLARELNEPEILGTALGHRGSFLSIQGKHKEAKKYYDEVYQIRVQTKDSIGLGYVLADLAEIVLNEGNLDQAMRYLDESTIIRQKIGDVQGVAVNSVNKGESYFNAGKFQQATIWFEKGLSQSLKIGFDDLSRHTYDHLGKTYEALGNYKKAYQLQEQAEIFKDSLYNAQRLKIIHEMQTKYETEKKEQQISLLNRENELKTATIERNYFLIGGLMVTLLLIVLGFYAWRYRDKQKQMAISQEQKVRLREAQVNAMIDSQEKERKRFASDLHDGMGQLISALQLNINSIRQSQEAGKRDSLFENSENILNDIHTEIRNIAFNLMPPVLIKEGLLAGITELIRRINKSDALKVKLSHHDIPVRFSELGEISLYRVIQELLSNIVKHSSAKEVTIAFTGFEDEVVLTIEDDGMGYNLTQFQNSEGNGWRNINSRLNLIRATIEFDVVEGRKNNTIIITVPKASIELTIQSNRSTNLA